MITVKIFFKSFSREQSVLALKACFLLLKKASLLSSKVQVIALPKKTQKFTVLKSPHVNKKSREQFMLQTHKHMLTLNVAASDGFVPPEENLQLKKFLLGLYGISFKGVEIKLTLLTHTHLQKHYE